MAPIKFVSITLTILMRMDAITAEKIFFTSKPTTTYDVIISTIPLIINVNNPKVIILIGRVKIIKIGLMVTFIIPKIAAAIIVDLKLDTVIPMGKYVII